MIYDACQGVAGDDDDGRVGGWAVSATAAREERREEGETEDTSR